jgi:anti-sigma factor RsiW
MNGCKAVQSKFTEYLDGRLNGREMQRIGAHLEDCRKCSGEWKAIEETHAALAALSPLKAPEDLALRIRVAISQECARRRQGLFDGWDLVWRNTLGPFLLQASAGFASAVLLMGTVIFLVTMFAQPQAAQAKEDEPLGNASAPRLLYYSSGAGDSTIADLSSPVMVEAYINGSGRVYDYRIVSGPTDAATRAQIESQLLYGVFAPARFFGQPVRGVAVISFSGVSVRG